jgi:hypothetical protein
MAQTFMDRCRATLRRTSALFEVWPPLGATLLGAAFVATVYRLVIEIAGAKVPVWLEPAGWLDPLVAVLGGFGGFLVVATLIFRKLDNDAEEYGLARGLATGYYLNFVKPLIGVLGATNESLRAQTLEESANESLYTQASRAGAKEVAGLVVCLPETKDQFDPENHDKIIRAAFAGGTNPLAIQEIRVAIKGRPRPIIVRLAVNTASGIGVLFDIPSTLAVIPDFADYIARTEAERSGDEKAAKGRVKYVTSREAAKFDPALIGRFQRDIEEFQYGVDRMGNLESRKRSPIFLLNVVPVRRMRRRMEELAGH